MLSLLKLKETKGKLEPYNTPIKCVIAATLPATTFTKNGVEKDVQHLVVCDNTSHMKAVCFETSKLKNLPNQPTVMIRNYVYNNDKIIITSNTQIFKTKTMEVDDTAINAAVQFLRPTTPPPAPVAQIKQSPIKTLQSVAGTVIQDEHPTEVQVKGTPVKLRSLTIEDTVGDKIKLALWRDMASYETKSGDYLTATNVLVTEYQNVKQLSTTSRTKLQISQKPNEELSVTVLAVEENDDDYTLLCQIDGTNLRDFKCKEAHITEMLPSDMLPPSDDTLNSLTDSLVMCLPGITKILTQQNQIVGVIDKIEKLQE